MHFFSSLGVVYIHFLIFCKDLKSRAGIFISINLSKIPVVSYSLPMPLFFLNCCPLKVKLGCTHFPEKQSIQQTVCNCLHFITKNYSIASLSVVSATLGNWWPVFWQSFMEFCLHNIQCQICCYEFLPCSVYVTLVVQHWLAILTMVCLHNTKKQTLT